MHPRPNRAALLAAAAAATLTGVVLLAAWKRRDASRAASGSSSGSSGGSSSRRRRSPTQHSSESTQDRNDGDLPPHIQRELHKDRRRKESVRFLAMKRPMYDNIEMYSRSGDILCTVSKKKADWYVRKNIAGWKSRGERSAIQLAFDPDVKSDKSLYTVSAKSNICVSCGDDRHFMRHYVVPYCYRTLLPDEYKSHTPHDIVLLCPECHLSCEQATQLRQQRMEDRLRTDPDTKAPVIKDRYLHHIRSTAVALLRHADRIPPAVVEKHKKTIRSHYNLPSSPDGGTDIPRELLEEASQINPCTPNPKHIPGPELVAAALETDEDIEQFIVSWRRFFLQVVQPRYLPTGWDVDSPVRSDDRSKS